MACVTSAVAPCRQLGTRSGGECVTNVTTMAQARRLSKDGAACWRRARRGAVLGGGGAARAEAQRSCVPLVLLLPLVAQRAARAAAHERQHYSRL